MNSSKSPSLEKLKELRSSVLAQEKARAQTTISDITEQFPVTNLPEPATQSISAPVDIAPIQSKAEDRILRHTEGTEWTREMLITELINQHLHAGYSGITYRTVPISREGCFFATDRITNPPGLVLKTGTGKYLISVRKENEEYMRWFDVYTKRRVADPHTEAAGMCLFELEQKLNQFSPGTPHLLFPEDFLVERMH